ncbi:MAG: hypothetical protein ACHQNA_00610 [Acidimicrobiales bacterium]
MNVLVDSCPELGVRNSQPEGIGRVVALTGMCAWNNLGRNVVFADRGFRALAVVGETFFPDDDEPSQYDLDVHAILELPEHDLVFVVNHLGLVRMLRASARRRPGPLRPVEPIGTVTFVGDAERIVTVGDRLVCSRPRSQRAPGLLVSQPVPGAPDGACLDVDAQAEHLGEVTALTSWPELGGSIAAGGEGRVSLAPLTGGVVGPPRWQAEVGFRPAVLERPHGQEWAAGSKRKATEIGDYDWEEVRGGGFVGLDPDDGRVVVEGRFTADLAWGNGGVAVVMFAGMVCGISRTGGLSLFRADTGEAVAATDPIAAHPLGIAHAGVVGDHLLVGWNRGGYRLHAFPAAATARAHPR